MDNKNSAHAEEIDLSIIFRTIKKVFTGIVGFFEDAYRLVLKRLYFIIIFSLLGGGAGVGMYFYTQPVYSANIVLSSSILSNDYCAELVNHLTNFTKDNSPILLAKKLNIDLSVAKEICSIEFSNYNEKIAKKYEESDTVVLGLPFKIKVYAINNTVFDSLQAPLVNYLENNIYALKRKVIKKQYIEQLKNKLNNEMVQIDSLKKSISENMLPRGNANSFVFGQPIDPINIYKTGIELFKNELDLNERIQLIDAIQIIDGFSPREKPDTPKLLKTIVIYGIIGFLLGVFIAFWIERKKNSVS